MAPNSIPKSDETPLEGSESAAAAEDVQMPKTYPVTVTDGHGHIDFGILLSCLQSEATVVGHPEARIDVDEAEIGIVRFTLSGLPDGTHDLAVVIDCQ